MIEVEFLTKIYKRRKFSVTALDRVSFILPDSGLVFIVGKSGSGKSTLLNLLGGLDEATSGDIIVDGLKFSEMKCEKSFDNYRAEHLGFVFQDFHLIEKLTVGENVGFALDLKNEVNEQKVSESLRQVGLGGFEKRYPAEMSGGQQQRVAIARAIIKDPRLILADEPTGNLDSATTKQILDLLKDLSKDRLVVVVSHSMDAAFSYADRIIELGDGKIVRDVTRSAQEECDLISDGVITLPEGGVSDDDIEKINAAVDAGNVRFTKQKSKFIDTNSGDKCDIRSNEEKINNKKRGNKPLKCSLALSFKLLRKGGLVSSVLISAFLIVLFVICMTLYAFDGAEIVKNAPKKEGYPVILQQQNSQALVSGSKSAVYKVNDNAEDSIRATGYDGNIYQLVNMGMSAKSHGTSLEGAKMKSQKEVYKEFFATETLGVLIADEDYLRRQFGDFEVLAGSLDATPYGIIITDYFADSILYYDEEMRKTGTDIYAKIVNTDHIHHRYKVNAVISTGYKEKYADLVEKYKEVAADKVVTSIELNEFTGMSAYADFLEDAQSRLNIGYTLNPNFMQAVVDNPTPSKYFCRLLNSEVSVDGKVVNDAFNGYSISADSITAIANKLKKGEAYISINFYNTLFGGGLTKANYSTKFKERTFTVREYANDDFIRENVLYEKTFTVKGIYNENEYFYVSDEDFKEMRRYDVFAYALVLDDNSQMGKVLPVTEELDMLPNAALYSDLLMVSKVMQVYKDVFLVIALVLLAAGFLVLVGFSVKNVSGRAYEIGIIRALGASEAQVMWIFVLQTIFAGVLICLLEVASQFAMLLLTNRLLTESLAVFMHNGIFKGMTLLTYNPVVSVLSLCAMAFITLVSVVFPIIKLSGIKPIEILRKKD